MRYGDAEERIRAGLLLRELRHRRVIERLVHESCASGVIFQKQRNPSLVEQGVDKEGRLGFRRPISEALGRQPSSNDFLQRHPFDVEPHSAQFEYYQVIIGEGVVRHADGETSVLVGDAFLFKTGEPHQIRNDSDSDLELLIVADNPVGESYYYYPDDAMWMVNSPEPHYVVLHPEREDP